MADLTGTSTPLLLDNGISLTAPGINGTAEVRPGGDSTDGRGVAVDSVDEDLQRILHTAGLQHFAAIDLEVDTEASQPPTGRAPEDLATLEVPAPDENQAAVLMIADEGSGLLTWHFPDRSPESAARANVLTFRISPRRLAAATEPTEQTTDRLGGWIAKRVLHVLVYPIAKLAVGLIAKEIAKVWEHNAHPYAIRQLAVPVGDKPEWLALSDAGWRALSGKKVLLLVHGIFSTIENCFSGLDVGTFKALASQYAAVIGFDHPTAYVDALDNVREFLNRVPDGATLDVDILTHSRGGLVARILSGELATASGELAMPINNVTVRKIVFVGTPNAGTVLVDPANLESLLNRFSSLLRKIPPGPWSQVTTVMETVVEIVKIVGMGAEGGLPGLVFMKPDSNIMTALNLAPSVPALHYAISTNFEPTGGLLNLLKDGGTDVVFSDVPNDVAVPTAGVGTVDGDPGFPVLASNSYTFPPGDVWHCTYFSQDITNQRVTSWLTES